MCLYVVYIDPDIRFVLIPNLPKYLLRMPREKVWCWARSSVSLVGGRGPGPGLTQATLQPADSER